MTTILTLFYSARGHVEALATAAAKAVEAAKGTSVLRRVPELDGTIRLADGQDAAIPIASLEDLESCNGLILATPTRFGMMCAQMRAFLDTTGPLWMKGALIGKPAAVMVATSTQHGGQEGAILSAQASLLHHGMIIVGLPYSERGQMTIDEITGGSPYGASTITGSGGPRMPSANELALAEAQARRLTAIATRLKS